MTGPYGVARIRFVASFCRVLVKTVRESSARAVMRHRGIATVQSSEKAVAAPPARSGTFFTPPRSDRGASAPQRLRDQRHWRVARQSLAGIANAPQIWSPARGVERPIFAPFQAKSETRVPLTPRQNLVKSTT